MKKVYRVYRKNVSILEETAYELYERLVNGEEKIGFLLESYDKNYDRFSILGIEPEAIITSKEQSILIKQKNGETEQRNGNPLELMKEYFNEFEILDDEIDRGFSGGLIGNLGYDFYRYTEKVKDKNPDEIGIETVQMMLATEFLVIDHRAEVLTAVVLETDDETGKEIAHAKAEQLIEKVLEKKNSVTDKEDHLQESKIVKKSDTIESYTQKVSAIKEYIKNGHIFQTVLSQRWQIETKEDGFELYKRLREMNPSPYLYYFHFEDFEVIGSSPEMLVKRQGKRVFTCPIAGTRPRGKSEAEDLALEQELLADEKELAEHTMLVDLARNDMGRIAAIGTVKVTELMKIQRYSHVMHIVSLVEGQAKNEMHPMDLIASFLPAGTLSGAPKIRAMEIIEELEETKRGLYGGATGYIDFSGNMDLCITIRTMIKKGKDVYLQAGAGIVADSNPKKEYEECCNKVMALAKTLIEKKENCNDFTN